jgi:hypothetical protein
VSADELRLLAEEDGRPMVLAMKLRANYKAVLRWLGEIGIDHEPRPVRSRNVVPAWVGLAYAPELGRRIRTRLYEVWASMRKRCLVPSCVDFPRYGGRGVTICDSWLKDFGAFRSWAVNDGGYRKGLTIDRKDSHGNYEPANCRFVTKADQQLNIRRAIQLTIGGKTQSLAMWARESGVSPDVIRTRVYSGWDHERAVFEKSPR